MIIIPTENLFMFTGEQVFTAGKDYETTYDVRVITSETSVKDDLGDYHRLGTWFTKFQQKERAPVSERTEQARKVVEAMTREQVGQHYAKIVGYNPFEDDPDISEAEVREMTVEMIVDDFN